MTDNPMTEIEKDKNTKQTQGNKYEQTGSSGISHMSGGEIKGRASVAGVILNIDADTVNLIQQSSNSGQNPPEKSPPIASNQIAHKQAKSKSNLGKVVSSDHKYDGRLVLTDLRFCDDSEVCKTKKISIILNISFGEVEEDIKYRDGVLRKVKEGHIRFGIKHGELYLVLQNGVMPLDQRELSEEPKENWQVITTGIKTNPVWEFKTKDQSDVLRGRLVDEKLGIINLSDTSCIVEATFQIHINNNDIEITTQDGAWDNNARPQVIATKRRTFFKRVVEPKLKDYLSKMVLKL